jgi:hypothetical protein
VIRPAQNRFGFLLELSVTLVVRRPGEPKGVPGNSLFRVGTGLFGLDLILRIRSWRRLIGIDTQKCHDDQQCVHGGVLIGR